jgi:hypothetical protein
LSRVKPLPPGTLLRLARLWPHARKKGCERGQLVRVGPYCAHCGLGLVWLFDAGGELWSTADRAWIDRHFEVVELSTTRDWYVWPPGAGPESGDPGG